MQPKTNAQITLIFVLLVQSQLLFGQLNTEVDRCHFIHSEHSASFERWLNTRPRQTIRSDELLRIPVVVHVIHNGDALGEGTNISDEQIFSQIRVMNEDFRRQEGSRGFNTHPDGGDAGIEFVLAKTDPAGNATDGIVRVDWTQVESAPFGGSMIAIGAYYSIWNPHQYLNIWAFPGFQDTGLGEARFPVSDLPGLEGEAAFPIPGVDSLNGIPVEDIDGIAINTVHFGEVDINSPYRFGRTGTHEAGHFLGLFHVWGDEGFDGSCEIDDYCEDTPNISTRTSGCPSNKLACDGSPAMIENYMDYTDDACMNIFTQDQIARMRTVLLNSPRRKSLLTSKGLFPPEDVSTDIPDDLSKAINLYPNPAKEYVHLDLPQKLLGTSIEAQFYDFTGALLASQGVNVPSTARLTFKLPPLQRGNIVLLKLRIDHQVSMHKLWVK